jgi:hypothetical protein
VFENRVLRKIFGPRRKEVTITWETLHYEELHDLYSLENVTPLIKSTRKRWAGRLTHGREEKCILAFGWKTSKKAITWRT